jgi:hypothetical protein
MIIAKHSFISNVKAKGINSNIAPPCIIINTNAKRLEKRGSRHSGVVKYINLNQRNQEWIHLLLSVY